MWGVEICRIYSKIMKKYHHCVKFTYPLSFQTRIPKVDQQTGGKWLIHGTKHRKDNQLQSLELSCRISFLTLCWKINLLPRTIGINIYCCNVLPDKQLIDLTKQITKIFRQTETYTLIRQLERRSCSCGIFFIQIGHNINVNCSIKTSTQTWNIKIHQIPRVIPIHKVVLPCHLGRDCYYIPIKLYERNDSV